VAAANKKVLYPPIRNQPFTSKSVPIAMQTARASQVKPMTIWCLAAIVLVASVLIIAISLFQKPASRESLEKQTPAAVSR
jgi:hypothetical protein